MLRGVVVTVALAGALFLAAPGAEVGGDEMFHLIWGAEIRDGQTPQLESSVAPTEHPLELLIAVPLSATGKLGDDGLRIIALLSLAGTAVALFRVGQQLFSAPVGIVAALVLVTRPHMLELAQRADPDLMALAAVAWATVVALEWPARRTLVLALLAVAGVLRPEAWLLALGYAAWAARGKERRVQAQLVLLALAGPLLWALSDLVLTGQPLLSLTRTRHRAELLGRETGLGAAFDLLPHHLGFLVGLPVLVVGILGLAAGLARSTRSTLVVAAGGAAIGAAFLVLALVSLPLQPRYLVGVAAVICLFAAVGAVGWLSLPAGTPGRGVWRALGVVGLAVLLAGVPADVHKHRQVRAALLDESGRLEDLTRGGLAARLRRCGPVLVTSPRAIPQLAYWAGIAPNDLIVAGAGRRAAHALVSPMPNTVAYLAGDPPVVQAPPAGLRLVAANEAWRAYADC